MKISPHRFLALPLPNRPRIAPILVVCLMCCALLAAPAIPSRATEPFSDVMVARSVALDDAHVAALACRVRHALERSRIARAFAMAPWTDRLGAAEILAVAMHVRSFYTGETSR